MGSPVFPGGVFPPGVFPPPVFPGEGEETPPPVAVGSYRHSAPAPIEKRPDADLWTLTKIHEAMED